VCSDVEGIPFNRVKQSNIKYFADPLTKKNVISKKGKKVRALLYRH
jgi:hypothetical protein